MIVLGLTFWKGSHDSSAAILKDGALVAAAEEERFSREKHDGRVPTSAIDYCLAEAGVAMSDVNFIAYPDSPFRTGKHSQLAEMSLSTLKRMMQDGQARRRSLWHKRGLDAAIRLGLARDGGMHPLVAQGFQALKGRYGILPPVRYYGHHLAHAAAAYLTSGFDDAAVVTMDGRGGPFSAATWSADGTSIDLMDEEPYTNSLGWFYRDCTRYAGLGDFGEGKLMGLAPYGSASESHAVLHDVIDTTGPRWFEYRSPPRAASVGFTPRKSEDVLSSTYTNFAANAQRELERGYERAARSALGRSESTRLCVGGGVAMNCSANGKLLSSQIASDMWVFPAAGDAGLSVGAALLCARDVGNGAAPRRMSSPYWGPSFSDDEIETTLASEKGISFESQANISESVAQLLAEGNVVGWFQGRMELGPRALGNRSIIADPRTTAMRDKVNRVKCREAWRPLAPSILADKTREYFEDIPPNAFMLFATQAKQITRQRAPAIVHVDGSARPQPVTKELNPLFFAVISGFEKLTGVPIVLNTSFNAAGEPIVCSPADAVRTFLSTELDVLAIGSYLVRKNDG